jgi:hypothetical protein
LVVAAREGSAVATNFYTLFGGLFPFGQLNGGDQELLTAKDAKKCREERKEDPWRK